MSADTQRSTAAGKLTPNEVAADVALTEAQAEGIIENVRPVRKNGRTLYRVDAYVEADAADALAIAVVARQRSLG